MRINHIHILTSFPGAWPCPPHRHASLVSASGHSYLGPNMLFIIHYLHKRSSKNDRENWSSQKRSGQNRTSWTTCYGHGGCYISEEPFPLQTWNLYRWRARIGVYKTCSSMVTSPSQLELAIDHISWFCTDALAILCD